MPANAANYTYCSKEVLFNYNLTQDLLYVKL